MNIYEKFQRELCLSRFDDLALGFPVFLRLSVRITMGSEKLFGLTQKVFREVKIF